MICYGQNPLENWGTDTRRFWVAIWIAYPRFKYDKCSFRLEYGPNLVAWLSWSCYLFVFVGVFLKNNHRFIQQWLSNPSPRFRTHTSQRHGPFTGLDPFTASEIAEDGRWKGARSFAREISTTSKQLGVLKGWIDVIWWFFPWALVHQKSILKKYIPPHNLGSASDIIIQVVRLKCKVI